MSHTVITFGFCAFKEYVDLMLQCGSEMVATVWLTEISSPFLHLREILKELGYRDTDLNLAADVSHVLN